MRTTRRAHGRSGQRAGYKSTRRLLCYATGVGLLAVFETSAASAAVPHFQAPPVISPFGLLPVNNFNFYTAPAVADLDADGDADFLLGDNAGNTYFYENTGSATAPAFGPLPVTNPFGLVPVGMRATPTLGDLDGDGDLDLILGDDSGDQLFFRNTGTTSAPAFAAPLTNPFGLSNVGTYSAPALVDIDADGDLDLFSGINSGDTYFFLNTGTPIAPAFAAGVLNPFGLSTVQILAVPTFVDIDGDGLLDAFVASAYLSIAYFHNVGSATAPSFLPALINPFGITPGTGGPAAFVDITADGFIDLFIGYGGYIEYYANGPAAGTPAPALAPWGLGAALALLSGVAFTSLRRR